MLTERLALLIDAKTDGAVAEMRHFAQETQKAGERAEMLKAKIADLDAKQAKAPSNVRELQLKRMRTEYDQLTSSLAKVETQGGKLDGALARIGVGGGLSTLKAIGPGLAAGVAAGGLFEVLKHGIEEYESLAASIRHVQNVAGGSAEDASSLVAVTKALGISADDAAAGMFRLGKNIETTPQKLDAVGVSIAKNTDGTTNLYGTLLNIADAYNNSADAAHRDAIVFQAFGRAGASMIPILKSGREELKQFADTAKRNGLIFNEQDLTNARELSIASRELKEAWIGLEVQASKGLVPALTSVAESLSSVIQQTHAGTIVSGLSKLNPLVQGEDAWHYFFGGGKGPSGKAKAEAALQLEETAAAAQQQQAAADALQKAVQSTLAAPYDTVALTENKKKAAADLASAKQDLAKAQDERDKALREVASAGKATGGATADQIAAAEARLHAAQVRLDQAQNSGRRNASSIASAQAAVESAQANLNKLQDGGAVSADKLASATDRLKTANQNLHDAQQKVADAQKAQTAAQGLTAKQVLDRYENQRKSQAQLAQDQVTLAGKGVTGTVLKQLDDLEKQVPGTLHTLATTMTAAEVTALDQKWQAIDAAQAMFSTAVGDAEKIRQAAQGAAAAKAFKDAYNAVLNEGLGGQGQAGNTPSSPQWNRTPDVPAPRGAKPPPAPPNPTKGIGGKQALTPTSVNHQTNYNLNGPITITDPKATAKQFRTAQRLQAVIE